jgi:hypothetical protein
MIGWIAVSVFNENIPRHAVEMASKRIVNANATSPIAETILKKIVRRISRNMSMRLKMSLIMLRNTSLHRSLTPTPTSNQSKSLQIQ